MAKIQLIPDYYDPTIIENDAEIEIFNIFKKSQNTDDWIVFHSLSIPKHVTQFFGEIDFLVLAPNLGIFALEVKEKLCQDGKAHYSHINRYGELIKTTKDSWRQAQDNMQSVRNYFPNHSWQKSLLFGYGVMIPSSNLPHIENIVVEREVVFDSYFKRNQSIYDYIKKLSFYFKNKRLGKFKRLPDSEQVKKMAKQLKDKFDCPILEVEKLSRSKAKIIEFSNDQTKIINYLVNSPRTLFTGPPGSGKTVLALYSLKKSILQNKKTLFCSFNKLIGYSIKNQLSSYSNDYTFYAGPFMDFIEDIVKTSFKDHKLKYNEHEYYNSVLPGLVIDFLQNNDYKFDYLIIDDAQDIFRENYLKILDLILTGGLKQGNWQLYCDFENQNIFVKDINIKNALGTDYLSIPLTINYRNCKRIANLLSKTFNLKDYIPYEKNEEGKKFKPDYYDNQVEGVKKLEGILEAIKSNDIPEKEVTILSAHISPHKNRNSLVYGLDKKYKIVDISDDDFSFFNTDGITFCSIYRFKGMENSYIIIVDVDQDMDLSIFESLLCTGMSRPLFSLSVLINSNIKYKTDELFKKHLVDKSI